MTRNPKSKIQNPKLFGVAALLLAATTSGIDFPPITPLSSMFRAHREKFLAKLPPDAVAVVRAAPLRMMSNDTEYPYRQESDFYYLTGYEEPDAVAVLKPSALDGKRFVLFLRPHD